MGRSKISRALLVGLIALSGVLAVPLFAQGPAPNAGSAAVEPVSSPATPRNLDLEHKFWDRENYALFAASAALSGVDFAVTRANLESGGKELNPVVRIFGRSDAGLAANFAGETAGIIGVSYFCHKTGHHRLERAVSLVNIGASAGAVSYGLAHQNSLSNTAGSRTQPLARSFSFPIKIPIRQVHR